MHPYAQSCLGRGAGLRPTDHLLSPSIFSLIGQPGAAIARRSTVTGPALCDRYRAGVALGTSVSTIQLVAFATTYLHCSGLEPIGSLLGMRVKNRMAPIESPSCRRQN